jgi:hypothetical protein
MFPNSSLLFFRVKLQTKAKEFPFMRTSTKLVLAAALLGSLGLGVLAKSVKQPLRSNNIGSCFTVNLPVHRF